MNLMTSPLARGSSSPLAVGSAQRPRLPDLRLARRSCLRREGIRDTRGLGAVVLPTGPCAASK